MQPSTAEKRCPKCRLFNPPEAERCDCGWDFATGTQQQSYLPKKPVPVAATVGVGVVVLIILLRLIVAFVARMAR